MVRCVLHDAQMVVVHDISGYPGVEQLADARGEDALQNHTGVRARDYNNVVVPATLTGIFPDCGGDVRPGGSPGAAHRFRDRVLPALVTAGWRRVSYGADRLCLTSSTEAWNGG